MHGMFPFDLAAKEHKAKMGSQSTRSRGFTVLYFVGSSTSGFILLFLSLHLPGLDVLLDTL